MKGVTSRFAHACSLCRTSHKACDGQRPCGRCVQRGAALSCRNVVLQQRGPKRRRQDEVRVPSLDLALVPVFSITQPVRSICHKPKDNILQTTGVKSIRTQFQKRMDRVREQLLPLIPMDPAEQERPHEADMFWAPPDEQGQHPQQHYTPYPLPTHPSPYPPAQPSLLPIPTCTCRPMATPEIDHIYGKEDGDEGRAMMAPGMYPNDPYLETIGEYVQHITEDRLTWSEVAVGVMDAWLLRSHIQQLLVGDLGVPFCVSEYIPYTHDHVSMFYIRFVAANESMCRVTECTRSELVAMDDRVSGAFYDRHNLRLRKQVARFIVSRPDPANAVMFGAAVFHTPSGKLVKLRARVQIFFTPQLEPALFLCVCPRWKVIYNPLTPKLAFQETHLPEIVMTHGYQ